MHRSVETSLLVQTPDDSNCFFRQTASLQADDHSLGLDTPIGERVSASGGPTSAYNYSTLINRNAQILILLSPSPLQQTEQEVTESIFSSQSNKTFS